MANQPIFHQWLQEKYRGKKPERSLDLGLKICPTTFYNDHFTTMLSGARFPAETNEILVSADQPRSPNPAGQRMVRLTIVEVPLLSPPKSGSLTNLRPNVRGLEQAVQRQVHHADVIRKDQNRFLYSIEQSANYSDQEHPSEWN